MSRPTFNDIYMRMALLVSERSTCRRLKVGCVIATADFRQVLAVGYNGNVAGGPNDCDRVGTDAVGNCGDLHAEANAVISCSAPRSLAKFVYVTDLPCETCAKYLVQLGGVERVFYARDYRRQEGEEILRRAGIDCGKFVLETSVEEAKQVDVNLAVDNLCEKVRGTLDADADGRGVFGELGDLKEALERLETARDRP